MNIAVMGHRGMLGQQVVARVMQHDHVLRIFYEDTWEPKGSRIEGFDPGIPADIDVVINCAGVVAQAGLPDKEMVFANAVAPHILVETCDRIGARLIHVSTDCVYAAPGPHSEASPISPRSRYGTAKAAGEITQGDHLTVRTSFIGTGPRGLLHELTTQESIEASHRLLWSGHTAYTVAEYLVLLAQMPEVTGLLHMPGEWQNRYSLCASLIERFGLSIKLIEKNDFFADRRLISTRWHKLGLPEIPPFSDQLAQIIL